MNTDGGNIFVGVDDDGNISQNIGDIDLLQRSIKDRIRDNIRSSTLGLFDVVVKSKNKKTSIGQMINIKKNNL